MTQFWQQILATLIGTMAGFLFSIALFYIKEVTKQKRDKKAALKHLKREISYNINLIRSWADLVGKAITQVTADDHQIYHYLPYSRYLRLFTQQAFGTGVLLEHLSDDDIAEVDQILHFFGIGTEQLVNSRVALWNGHQVEAKDALRDLRFHEETLARHGKTLERIAAKLS